MTSTFHMVAAALFRRRRRLHVLVHTDAPYERMVRNQRSPCTPGKWKKTQKADKKCVFVSDECAKGLYALTALIMTMQEINAVNSVRLPPSSKRVLTLLEDGKTRTFKQVTEEIDISPRTIRYAIKKLKENGLIIEKFNFRDARQVLYQIKDTIRSDDAQKATA